MLLFVQAVVTDDLVAFALFGLGVWRYTIRGSTLWGRLLALWCVAVEGLVVILRDQMKLHRGFLVLG